MEGFSRRFESQALSREAVEPMLGPANLSFRHISEVGLLGQTATDQAGRVLDRALLPAVHRRAEVRCGSKALIDLEMTAVLGPIVVSDAAPELLGISDQCAADRASDGRSVFGLELGEPSETSLAFDQNLERDTAFPADNRISFPMSWLGAAFNHLRALGYRCSRRDFPESVLAAREAAAPPSAMRANQQGRKIARFGVNPLVNRLVADWRVAQTLPAARDSLRRPPEPEHPNNE